MEDVAGRIKKIQLIEKINENKNFSRKIGLKDVSVFKKSDK